MAHQTEYKKLEKHHKRDRRQSFLAKVTAPSQCEDNHQHQSAEEEEPPQQQVETPAASRSVPEMASGEGSGIGSGQGLSGSSSDPQLLSLLQALLESQERTNKLLMAQIQYTGQFEVDSPVDNTWKVDLTKLLWHLLTAMLVGGTLLALYLCVAMQLAYKQNHR